MVAGEPDLYGVAAGRRFCCKVQGPVCLESRVGCENSSAVSVVMIGGAAFCNVYFLAVLAGTDVVFRLDVHVVQAVWHFDIVGLPLFSGFFVVVPHQPGLRLYRHGGSDLVIEGLAAEGAVRGDVQVVPYLYAAQRGCRSGRQGVRRAEFGVGLSFGIVVGKIGFLNAVFPRFCIIVPRPNSVCGTNDRPPAVFAYRNSGFQSFRRGVPPLCTDGDGADLLKVFFCALQISSRLRFRTL